MPTSEMESSMGDGISFAETFSVFNAASPSGLVGAFWPLLESLWTDGTARPGAYDAVPALVSAFPGQDGRRQALTALLLGLLAEAEGADTATRTRIRGTVGGALDALAKHAGDPMLRSALLFLVEHFPEDADRIRATAEGVNLTAEESSRLERCLSVPDVADKEGVLRVGRNFPAPSVWDVPADELPGVGGWASWLDLDAEKIELVWAMDADSMRAVDGGRALWLAQDRELAPYDPESTPVVTEPDPARFDVAAAIGPTPLGAVLACPACHGPLSTAGTDVACTACDKTYPAAAEWLDFIPEIDDIYDPFVLPAYGRGIREAFLRLVGENWGAALTLAQEDAFLREHFVAGDGPIVDIGPDNGKTTKLFADLYGADRIVVLDQSGPMLRFVRGRAHGMTALRAMCYTMPFADHSLGAVNCWNVWQGASDKPSLLTETRRVLRPGGVFTFLAYRPSPNPVGRYFQQKLNIKTLDLYEPDALRAALDETGFDVSAYAEHGSGLMLVAARARELD
jgi:SAM-dependent methyltransferase